MNMPSTKLTRYNWVANVQVKCGKTTKTAVIITNMIECFNVLIHLNSRGNNAYNTIIRE